MGLIKCAECGKEFSDRIKACPHCGCPIKYSLEEAKKQPDLNEQEENLIENKSTHRDDRVVRSVAPGIIETEMTNYDSNSHERKDWKKRRDKRGLTMSYRCSKCGHGLSDGAKFCPYCGEIQPEKARVDNEIAKKAKGKARKIAVLIVALLALGSGSLIFTHQRALHVMPDVVDMNVHKAITTLTQDGVDENRIAFVDKEGIKIKKHNDWFVLEQEPSAGSQFNVDSDELILTIFDQASFEVEQIKGCEGDKLYKAVETAEGYNYRVEIQAEDKKNPITTSSFKNSNANRQKEWIATKISDLDKKQKTVTIVADTEANIEAKEEAARLAKAEAALKRCVDKPAPEATAEADKWKFKYTLFNYRQEDCTEPYNALDDTQKDQWLVIEVKEINRNQLTVAFIVDTKENIVAREKDTLKACVDKTVVDAQAVIEKLHYKYELVNYDGQEYTSNYAALSKDEKAQWIVMAVSDIDADDKTVTISIDTKQNIEARKKAEEEKKKAEAEAAAAAAAAAATRSNTSGGEEMVWVPRTGHKFHSNPNCSNMKNPIQMPRSEAEKNYDPCSKCY